MISDDPYPVSFVIQSIIDFQLIQESIPSIVGSLLLIVVFLILSALFSASENALFSLSSKDMEEIKTKMPRLLDNNFKVEYYDNISDIIDKILIN
jgi:hypothetical protein